MDEIVRAVWQRLETKATDLGSGDRQRLKPAHPAAISNDEKRLGFKLPPLLKRIYVEIGNGGFGPGYGLIGLTGGVPDDLGQTVPLAYDHLRCARQQEPNWNWPEGLLPICHWGCAILSCVDCANSDFSMRVFDPNLHVGNDWSDTFFEDGMLGCVRGRLARIFGRGCMERTVR